MRRSSACTTNINPAIRTMPNGSSILRVFAPLSSASRKRTAINSRRNGRQNSGSIHVYCWTRDKQIRPGVAMRRTAMAAILPLLLGESFTAFAAINEPIKLDSGMVTGTPGRATDTRAFKGIPFAASPVGDLRWREPQAVAHWDGVRKADELGPVCMQNGPGGGTSKPSEDCLYLNVWTGADSASEKRPVMVWIYGGGFNTGSASQPDYDGENLAKKGAVVVTFNYRLGAFGFFAHPELTKESDRRGAANFGMLDAIAVLQWVQRNVAAFGGD